MTVVFTCPYTYLRVLFDAASIAVDGGDGDLEITACSDFPRGSYFSSNGPVEELSLAHAVYFRRNTSLVLFRGVKDDRRYS